MAHWIKCIAYEKKNYLFFFNYLKEKLLSLITLVGVGQDDER